jgi:hypothetical protein
MGHGLVIADAHANFNADGRVGSCIAHAAYKLLHFKGAVEQRRTRAHIEDHIDGAAALPAKENRERGRRGK